MDIFVCIAQEDAGRFWTDLFAQLGFRSNVCPNLGEYEKQLHKSGVLLLDQTASSSRLIDSVASIVRRRPSLRIIATSGTLTLDEAVDLMRAGATHVCRSPQSQHVLDRQRLRSVVEETIAQAKDVMLELDNYALLESQFALLTYRERDVLDAILIGSSNKDTAAQLNVSVRTVESRRAKVYRKLESKNVSELVRKIDRLETLRERYAPRAIETSDSKVTTNMIGFRSSSHSLASRHSRSSHIDHLSSVAVASDR